MIAAERHHKQWLPAVDGVATLRRQEDLLTSHVFSLLRYLPHRWGIGKLLALLQVENDERAEVCFWPSRNGTEPDVVIDTRDTTVLIECKLWSNFGANQLGREWIYLLDAPTPKRVLLVPLLVDVTTATLTRAAIDRDLSALGSVVRRPRQDEVHPLTWSELGHAVLDVSDVPPHVGAVLDDLRFVLKSRGVSTDPFRGWPAPPRGWGHDARWYAGAYFRHLSTDATTRAQWGAGPAFYPARQT